jgi:hypothetical protein
MRNWTAARILEVLDECCDSFTFPILDNGYIYLAATRMSLYRSETDWGLVIEIFGFSPRSGLPHTYVDTFSSALHARRDPGQFVNEDAYNKYLSNNPYNESSIVEPIQEGDWIDTENPELIAPGEHDVCLRGHIQSLPSADQYARAGISHSEAPRITVFEFCRALALSEREQVLATPSERTAHLDPKMREILLLDEWNHPDVIGDEHRPSNSKTFAQLAEVLSTGDTHLYKPTEPPNTHWKHWPDGGTL